MTEELPVRTGTDPKRSIANDGIAALEAAKQQRPP